jgi:hypothetical protein
MAEELTDINKANEMAFAGIVLPCSETTGIKCDFDNPTYGWKDLVGQIVPRSGGQAAPAFTAFRGGKVKEYAFSNTDIIDNITFHMPHDYVLGSDMFIHIHWGHNGTAISGTFAGNMNIMYSKGYTQAGEIFEAETVIPWTLSTPDVTTFPRWSHNIHEFQMSAPAGAGGLIDTDKLEIDGLIVVQFETTTVPSITGSATSNLPYVFTIDIHYQSTETATKNRNYPFYGV